MQREHKDQSSNESQSRHGGTDVRIDQARLQVMMQEVRARQNFAGGLLAGFIAALLGAVIWAAVTAATNYQIGWMAIGIGFFVGIAIRKFGQGIDLSFGVMGAVLALFGCVVGNLFTVCIQIANDNGMGYFEVLGRIDFSAITGIMVETFHPMDLLFYGIAMYFGYKYAFYTFSEEDKQSLMKQG